MPINVSEDAFFQTDVRSEVDSEGRAATAGYPTGGGIGETGVEDQTPTVKPKNREPVYADPGW